MKHRWKLFLIASLIGIGCGDDDAVTPEPDETPPGTVSDLSFVSHGDGNVTLTWTSPGDDGTEGQASTYDIRTSAAPLDEQAWSTATRVESPPAPRAPGMQDSFVVSLDADASVYIGMKAADEIPNWSALSNIVRIVLGDTTAPAAVSDLTANASGPATVTLQWTAPGDDGTIGTAVEYDLRHAPEPITEATWPSAMSLPKVAAPASPGSHEQITVTLEPGELYHFAIRTRDESGNWSGLSNGADADLSIDKTPPAAITDLNVEFVGGRSVTMTWTAPGDDGSDGRAAHYDGRYSTDPIDEDSWESALPWSGLSAPAHGGNLERLVVDGLELEQAYFFALRAVDESGNMATLSNVVEATTVALVQLTQEPSSFANYPSWSPDGQWIAFSAFWSGDSEIYLIAASGGDVRRLTSHPATDLAPRWSPDGQSIGFLSDRNGNTDIWSIDPFEQGATAVRIADHEKTMYSWTWSPDGTSVAFAAQTSPDPPSPLTTGIFIAPISMGAPVQIVDDPSINTELAWSPDGSQIAFGSNRAGDGDIWIVPASGGVAEVLTDAGNEGDPTWSSDGERIAFTSNRSGGYEIWSLEMEGRHLEQLTDGHGRAFQPCWSPSGDAVAFISDRSGAQNVWIAYR